MNLSQARNVGDYVKLVTGVAPANSAAGAVNGAAIDRLGYESCVLRANTGAASGSPTVQTIDAKLQESDDGSTGWADITGAAVTQIAADATAAEVDVDLSGVKRYIRAVRTTAFTGGISPAWPNSVEVVLGGPVEVPAA